MAKGSEMKFGERDARVCCLCHERIVLGGDRALTFYHAGQTHIAWHCSCGSPFAKAAA